VLSVFRYGGCSATSGWTLVCVIGRKVLAMLLNRRHCVLLLDEALCVLGVVATVQLYFIAEKRLEILIRRPSTWCTEAAKIFHVCAQ
jgi:hypothetical protein